MIESFLTHTQFKNARCSRTRQAGKPRADYQDWMDFKTTAAEPGGTRTYARARSRAAPRRRRRDVKMLVNGKFMGADIRPLVPPVNRPMLPAVYAHAFAVPMA
jgi:hypothetical protein